MKKIIGILTAAFLFWGCQTTQEGLIVVSSVGTADYAKVEEIETKLLDWLVTENRSLLDSAEREINTLLETPSFNKEYEARILGLLGEVYYYQGKEGRVKAIIEEIELKTKKEPQLYILKSLIARDPAEKIQSLEEGITVTEEKGKMSLYLARLYMDRKEYGKATGYFDEAFLNLEQKYVDHFTKERELAFQFIQNPPGETEAIDFLSVEQLTVEDVLFILTLQTRWLESLEEEGIKKEKLLEKMKEEKYLFPGYLRLKDPLVRKDIAYLFLAIIARLENDPDLMHRFQDQFMEFQLKSPVPDVPRDEYYFDPVLVLVEREIMELPDGINFLPNKTVSGLELNELISRIKLFEGE